MKIRNTRVQKIYKKYKKYTKNAYSFLTIDTTLPADDPLRLRKNLLDSLSK